MVLAWVITRNLTEDVANTLDITNLKAENDNNKFEALKVKLGFQKIGVKCKIVTMDQLVDAAKISKRDLLPDIIVIRCMTHNMQEIDALKSLFNHKLTIMNSIESQTLCMNKWLHYGNLKKYGIPIPITTVVRIYANAKEIHDTITNAGLSFPIIVKSNGGSRSDSVFKCYTIDEVLDSADKIQEIYHSSKIMILQQWIDHRSKGVISVLTLGDKAIAAQQRTANREIDFFISNFRKDTNRCAYEIDDDLRKLVESAIKIIGNVEMSRLDILHDGQKYLVCEVNSPGAFTAFDNFMGMDCGLMIAEYAFEKYKKNNKLI